MPWQISNPQGREKYSNFCPAKQTKKYISPIYVPQAKKAVLTTRLFLSYYWHKRPFVIWIIRLTPKSPTQIIENSSPIGKCKKNPTPMLYFLNGRVASPPPRHVATPRSRWRPKAQDTPQKSISICCAATSEDFIAATIDGMMYSDGFVTGQSHPVYAIQKANKWKYLFRTVRQWTQQRAPLYPVSIGDFVFLNISPILLRYCFFPKF